MTAVILAAGLGTRMRGLTENTPKPLLKIGERTLLEHKLHHLPDEIDEVIIVIGYLGEQIQNYLGSEHAGRKIRYVEQKELLGTGHALSLCQPLLRGKFLVLMGDDLYAKEDLVELIKYPLGLLALELTDDLPNERRADVRTDASGKMTDIVEDQPVRKGMLECTGAYVLDEAYFAYPLRPAKPNSKELGLPQTMVQLVKDGKDIQIVKATWWKKVTSPEDLVLEVGA